MGPLGAHLKVVASLSRSEVTAGNDGGTATARRAALVIQRPGAPVPPAVPEPPVVPGTPPVPPAAPAPGTPERARRPAKAARVSIERRLLFRSPNGIVGVPVTCRERRCRVTVLLRQGRRVLAVRHRVSIAAGRTGMVHVRLRSPQLARDTMRVRVVVHGGGVAPRSALRTLVPFGPR